MSGDWVNVKVVERLIRFGKQLPGYDTYNFIDNHCFFHLSIKAHYIHIILVNYFKDKRLLIKSEEKFSVKQWKPPLRFMYITLAL